MAGSSPFYPVRRRAKRIEGVVRNSAQSSPVIRRERVAIEIVVHSTSLPEHALRREWEPDQRPIRHQEAGTDVLSPGENALFLRPRGRPGTEAPAPPLSSAPSRHSPAAPAPTPRDRLVSIEVSGSPPGRCIQRRSHRFVDCSGLPCRPRRRHRCGQDARKFEPSAGTPPTRSRPGACPQGSCSDRQAPDRRATATSDAHPPAGCMPSRRGQSPQVHRSRRGSDRWCRAGRRARRRHSLRCDPAQQGGVCDRAGSWPEAQRGCDRELTAGRPGEGDTAASSERPGVPNTGQRQHEGRWRRTPRPTFTRERFQSSPAGSASCVRWKGRRDHDAPGSRGGPCLTVGRVASRRSSGGRTD